ncbi:MAG: response regulator, partial [Kofleriaceae bacterium]
MGRILIVDDEQSMREFLAICLRRAGHTTAVATSGEQAVQQLAVQRFDIVVTDLKMPGTLDGIGLLDAIKSGTLAVDGAPLDCEVILVTAFATAETAIAAMKKG